MAKGARKDKDAPKAAPTTPPADCDKPFSPEDEIPQGLGNALNSKVLLSLGPLKLTRYEAFELVLKTVIALVVYFVILKPKDEAPPPVDVDEF